MKSSLRQDLGIQLFVIYLCFLLIVSSIAFYFAADATDQLKARISNYDLALAHVIAEETFTSTQSALIAVDQLGQNPAIITGNSDAMLGIFENVLTVRDDANLIYRLDEQGIMQFHYPIGPESTVGTDFSFREYFQRAVNEHAPFLSLGRISPTTNQPVATAVMPLWSEDGTFLGVVAMNIRLQFLSRTLANIVATFELDPDLEIAIIDNSGQIIAHSDSKMLLQDSYVVFPEITPLVLSGQQNNLVLHNQNHEENLYNFVPIQGVEWGVIISHPTQSAYRIIRRFQYGIVVVVSIFLILGLVFWWILYRRIISPLEQLAQASESAWLENYETGDITQMISALTHRTDQMGILTRSVHRMKSAMDAQFNQLSTLLKTSGSVVSTLDSKLVLERILAHVEQLLDVQMSAIFALDAEAQLFRVQASRNLPQQYVAEVQIDPQDPRSITMQAIRAGKPIQIADTENDPAYSHNRHRARQAGFRALLAINLPAQHAMPSVLAVYRSQPRPFSDQEVKLLTSFANHAAMAIENATLYARSDMNLREQTQRLESLIQSMEDGLVLEDTDGYVLYINRKMLQILQLPYEAVNQKPIQVVIDRLCGHTDNCPKLKETIAQLSTKHDIRQIEFPQVQTNPPRHMRLTLFEVKEDTERTGQGWIVQDITEHYEIDRMKSILIATASHELRTPLAAIKGYVTTLLADDVVWDADSRQEFLRIISAETDRLNDLVYNILDMSRIESGKAKIRPMLCELPELIDRAIEHTAITTNQIKVDMPGPLPLMFIDVQRIETVLVNLISNAAKYSPEGSPIQIEVRQMEFQQIIVYVKDQGQGIPLEHQERVFDIFYRIDSGLERKASGAGLGLAIARSFVQAHGGKMWIEPSPQGTCIAFSLPVQEIELIEEANEF